MYSYITAPRTTFNIAITPIGMLNVVKEYCLFTTLYSTTRGKVEQS
jgi:hypothetical protein